LSAGAGAAGEWTTSLREEACDESTPRLAGLNADTSGATGVLTVTEGSSTTIVPLVGSAFVPDGPGPYGRTKVMVRPEGAALASP
jgi:hypothetical protein